MSPHEPEPESGSEPAGVRLAWAADAPAIARVQVRAWRASYADVLPADVLAALDEEAFAVHWRESLARPPDSRNRVLVALAPGPDPQLVGYALTGPCHDPDADPVRDGLVEGFHVDPEHTGHGHGSRLLQACVDTMRADGFARSVAWLAGADDALRVFLAGAGWSPDGAHRELDLHGDGTVRVKQVRLHCSLEEA